MVTERARRGATAARTHRGGAAARTRRLDARTRHSDARERIARSRGDDAVADRRGRRSTRGAARRGRRSTRSRPNTRTGSEPPPASAAAADDLEPTKPEGWDDEEDGEWEAAWEPVWWTLADQHDVEFIEAYDLLPDMQYRYNGFRHRIVKAGKSGLQSYGPTVACHILGDGWTVKDFVAEPRGQPLLKERNKKKPLKVAKAANVMQCWEEAINHMEIGATWEFVCTPELGYGGKKAPGVPPHSALIFNMTLVKCDATRTLVKVDEETGKPYIPKHADL